MKFQKRISPTKMVEWLILILISVITFINYFDRASISFAIAPIQMAFGIDNREFGIIAAGFGLGYLVMSLASGLLVDRFGTIRIWPAAVGIWSVATMLMGFSSGFWSLLLLRIILGLAEAVHFPALLKTITDWLEPRWRTRFISIGLLGIPLASALGAPLLSIMINAFGWRSMFISLGLIGLVWMTAWIFFFRWLIVHYHRFSKAEKGDKGSYSNIKLQSYQAFKKIFSSKIFIGNCLNKYVNAYTVYFSFSWLPGYLQQTYDINIIETGYLLTIPWLCGSLFILIGGWLSDYLWHKTLSSRKSRIYLIGCGVFLSGICFLGNCIAATLTMDMIMITLGLGFAFFALPAIYSLNVDLFKDDVGTAQGVMIFFGALAGMTAPSITGWIAQATSNFNAAIYVIVALSMISACVAFFIQNDEKL